VYRKTTLANGIRVITESMPAVRSATIGIWADVGSAAESPERRGISHVVEHMLFKGTKRRTARQIAETMDGVGGNLNAFTDKETTCYYAKVIDRHIPLAIDVLSDMFLNSLFDAAELTKEQKVVLEEIKMYDDSPDELIHDLFTSAMWTGSNLGDPTIGTAESVSAISREQLCDHMRRHYAPNAVVVTAAGSIDHAAFVDLIERAFDGFDGTSPPVAPEAPLANPVTLVKQKDIEQAHLVIGSQGLSVRDERRYVLAVLDTILGGGMSSRLFQEVREKRGLVYSVYSYQAAYRAAGLFGAYAASSPQNVRACIDVIAEEFERVVRDPVGAEELVNAKEHIKGSLTLSLESTSSRMIRLGRNEFALGREVSPEEVERRVDAVTLEDVQAIAHEILDGERIGLCVLGPVDESAIGRHRFAA
jgi:predicted Zn-dependent peptidase